MPSVNENLSAIRLRLKEPNPQAPSSPQLLNLLIDHIADHQAQLQNSRNHWSIGWTQISASQGQEDYAITASDFGRPFLVYTVDESDSFHQRREIPFSMLQDTEQRYLGPQQTQSASPWSAVEISFFRQSPSNPAWYARLTPIPNESCVYKIGYEANYDFGALADSPGLSPFHHVIRTQAALSALPLCEWGEITILKNPAAWKTQADALRQALMLDLAGFQKHFDSYKAQASREGISQKRGVGCEYEEQWGYDGGSLVRGYGW